jgi:ATP/maltotriose-dependent transcriptional regulator MalT
MAEGNIPGLRGETTLRTWDFTFASMPAGTSESYRFLDAGRTLAQFDVFSRCKTQRNLTGTSLPQIRRSLTRAWRMISASQISDAFSLIDRIELELGDLPTGAAERFHTATKLLRAVGLAFQDDNPAALSIAAACLNNRMCLQDRYVALTLCHFAYWQLGELDAFYSLPRCRSDSRSARNTLTVFDLSIQAAVELEQLRFSTAKRLASDALNIAETPARPARGLAALPACLMAQMLYEEGYLDEAEITLRDRLSAIGSEGTVDSALRAYLILARIATYRRQYDFAALLLRQGEALGRRRRWPRLVAASLAERALFLLQEGQMGEARRCVEHLDRYAETCSEGPGHLHSVMRYRTLAYSRVSAAEAPSAEAVAALRLLYHQALEKKHLYTGCRLAVELAVMLAAIGESAEADTLILQTLKIGSALGLYQVFLDGGVELGVLLKRSYEHGERPGSENRELLPYVGSLLSHWNARDEQPLPARPSTRVSDALSTRESDVLLLIGRGLSNKQIAQSLKISPETVKSHVKNIFLKLAVGSRAGALGLL